MTRTITFMLVMFSLSASLTWGSCSTENCTDRSPELPLGDLAVPTAPSSGTESPRGTSRSFSAGNFLNSAPPEKACSGNDCREPKRPRVEPRSPQSREGDGKDGMITR